MNCDWFREVHILAMFVSRGQSFSDDCPGIFEDFKDDPKTSEDFRR